jgi:hypothetical protein
LPSCKHEFLPREHSEDYGNLDESNWKDLTVKRHMRRVDPAIQELISFLNEKGFTTFSSCSGGHWRDMRKRKHEEGYVAFSPPSRVAFKLYFALQGRNRRFDFRAAIVINNEDRSIEQTVDSELRSQLKDRYSSKRRYYFELFADITKLVKKLKPVTGNAALPRAAFGSEAVKAQKILKAQQTRFRR